MARTNAVTPSTGNDLHALPYNVDKIRGDFPILDQCVYGKALVFLDNAASTQKPGAVINAMAKCYTQEYANVHRGVYYLSEKATEAFEDSRHKIKGFINASEDREIIFVRGATEAINLVASSYGGHFLKKGDEVVISEMEHHSNIVPWQILRDRTGIVLKVIPITDKGELQMEAYKKLLNARTKLVAVTQVSNALGTVTPIKEVIDLAHEAGAKVLVDGCQAIGHMPVDVQALDCDFYVFSGHKMYGPTGIGVLYGKAELLEAMPPYQGGGEMISSVTFEKTEYNVIPYKFEAGTPAIAEVIGLGAAVDYLKKLGMANIAAHERALLHYAIEQLSTLQGLRIIGTATRKTGIVSFILDDIHPHDIGTVLDRQGVAVRTGHHCAMPVMQHFGIAATARASLGIYNTKADIDALVAGLQKTKEFFGT